MGTRTSFTLTRTTDTAPPDFTQPNATDGCACCVSCVYSHMQPKVARSEQGSGAWSIGSIEREIHIEATPEVVYEVVSTPGAHQGVVAGARPSSTRCPGGPGRSRSATSRRHARRSAHRRRGRPAAPVLVPLGLRRGRRRRRRQLAAGDLRPGPVGDRHPAAVQRGGLPREGLGGRGPRGAVPRPRRRLGLLPAAPRRVRRPAGVARHEPPRSTTTSGRPSATRPGGGCSTCCSPTAAARPPR